MGTKRRVVWLVVLSIGTITTLFVSASVALIALPRTTALPDAYGLPGVAAVTGLVLTSLGGAIALRQPRNSIGWIFLVSGMFTALLEPASEYGSYALVERGGMLPGAEWAIWLTSLALPLAFGPVLTYVLLVFPNGQLPSVRWRPVAWYTVAALVAAIAANTLAFNTVGYGDVTSANPVSLGFALNLDEATRVLVMVILVGPAAILCGAAFVHRFRASRGVERQQLKWVAYAAVVAVVVVFLLPVAAGRKPLEIVKQLAITGVPVAAGIAILRYHLYDIDLLISQSLVYGTTSAAIAAMFYVGLVVLQPLLRPLTSGSELAVAASTLVCFALFQPIRRRVQDVVDRRFYRTRYDAARTMDEFAYRLRDEVDIDPLCADLLGVVQATMAPSHASLWLRKHAR